MTRYTIGRLSQAALTLVLSSLFVFAAVHVLPGNPADAIAGPSASQATIKAITVSLGLDRPLPVQYVDWVGQLFHGNLGRSYIYHVSASSLIFSRLPWSLVLAGAGLVIAALVAIPLGMTAATRPGGAVDSLTSAMTATMVGIPAFVLGILLILVLAVDLHWLPVGATPSWSTPLLTLKALILPAVALAFEGAATLIRITKSTMQEALSSAYVRTGKAKGASPLRILFAYALRNAAVPLVTVLGVVLGRTIAGAIVIEQVFAWPGIGQLLIDGISNRDYTVVQGCLLMLVLIFLAINLATDLLYGLLDPRLRVGSASR